MRFEKWPIRAHLENNRPMFLAIFSLAVFAVAIGVTAFAIVTAKDGYEDRFGFHEASIAQVTSKASDQTSDSRTPIPPFAAAS